MRLFRITVVVCALAVSAPALAQPSCDTTFTAASGSWGDDLKWNNGVPDSSKVACITNGASVDIFYLADQYAKAIYIDSTSEVVIYGGDTLVIAGGVNSQIDGQLAIYNGSGRLTLEQSHTIYGSGDIAIYGSSGNSPGIVDAVSGSPVLTLGYGMGIYGGGSFRVDVVMNGYIHASNFTLEFQEGLTLNGSMTIDAGKIVEVSENLSVASGKTISIANSGGNVGKLKARSGYSPGLTVASGGTIQGTGEVHLPTTVNGTAYATGGDLFFKSSLTLNGILRIDGQGTVYLSQNLAVANGATIWMETLYSNISKLKPQSGNSPTLTVNSGGLIKGAGEIHIAPINNGTTAARDGTLDLKLGGSGSGKWTAETSTGRLLVSGAVTGSGLWELDDHASAKIEIDAACACLIGDVIISKGILDVDANFTTSGQLTFSGKDSLVDVAGSKSAKFSQPTGCMEE